MTHEELKDLIALGEGFTVEFKRSGVANLGRELCAFANSTGGVVLIGVEDDGTVVGVENHNRLKSEIQSVARSMDPSVAVDVESVGKVLCVNIPEQQGKPFSFGGRFYLRDGASTQQMGREEIRIFFFKEGLIQYDEKPCPDFDIDRDLTPEIWSRFVTRAKIPDNVDPGTTLRNLHLIKDGYMTHAGAWLLTNDITRYTLSAGVICAIFRGTTKTHILDRKEFTGDLYSIYQDCMAYMQAKLNTEFIITTTGREERLELPGDALREALVNAIAHRDYRSTANIQIQIFHDRLEIISPGGLPAGMDKKDLGRKSVPRNPLLFGMLYRMGLVEQVGSGIIRIRGLCREYGVTEPRIEVDDNWVTLVFERKTEMVDLKEDGEVGTKLGPSRDQAGTKPALSRHQAEILHKCFVDTGISELMTITGRKNRTKFRDQVLGPLLEAGLIEMTIPDKPTSPKQRYRLTEKGRRVRESSEGIG